MSNESNRDYFIKAEESASDRYMNASGAKNTGVKVGGRCSLEECSMDGGNWDFEMFDDELNFDDELINADATPSSNFSSSQPYILRIENTSGGTISSVVALGARTNLPNNGVLPWNWGNNGAITITMGVSGVTYPQFLYQTLTNGFTVGLLYLHTTTSSQINATITVQHNDANGNLVQHALTPVLDPYQWQGNAVSMKESFSVDGDTELIISSVLANEVVTIYLYPSDVVNPRLVLGGQDLVSPSSAPQIGQPQLLNISQSQVTELKNRLK